MPYAIHEFPLPRAASRPESAAGVGGIDVSATLKQLAGELGASTARPRRLAILAILHRWSWDPMLSASSRLRARTLLEAHRHSA